MYRLAVILIFAAFLASCGGGGSSTPTVPQKSITSIQISPPTSTLQQGSTQQFTATATFSDGSTQNITTLVTWTSSDPSAVSFSTITLGLATVGANANLSALTITASMSGVTGMAPLTVIPGVVVSFAVDCDTGCAGTLSLPSGVQRKLVAIVTLQGGGTRDVSNSATWNSSTPLTASVDTTGLVTAAQLGNATITATSGSMSASKPVTVVGAVVDSVKITPNPASLAKNTTQQFTATATYTDGRLQNVTTDPLTIWTSDDHAILNFLTSANPGLATGLAVGATEVHVSYTVSQPFTDTANVTVTPSPIVSIQIFPNNTLLPSGQRQKFILTARAADGTNSDVTSSATWSSSDTSVATINAGLAVGVGTSGQTTITGSFNSSGNTFTGQTALVATAAAPIARFAYVSTGNGIAVYPIDATTGALASLPSSILASLSGILRLDPQGKFLFVLTPGGVVSCTLDAATGVLQVAASATFPSGSTGTGIAVDPLGKFVFAATGSSGQVFVYSLDRSTGVLAPVAGSPFSTGLPAAFLFTTGQFLYAANGIPNGNSTITGFSIDRSNGALTQVTGSPFAAGIDTTEITGDSKRKYLYAGNFSTSNADPSNVMTFSIDQTSGALAFLSRDNIINAGAKAHTVMDRLDRYLFSGDNRSIIQFNVDPSTGLLINTNASTDITGVEEMAGDVSGRFFYTTQVNFSNNNNFINSYTIDALSPQVYQTGFSVKASAAPFSIVIFSQ